MTLTRREMMKTATGLVLAQTPLVALASAQTERRPDAPENLNDIHWALTPRWVARIAGEKLPGINREPDDWMEDFKGAWDTINNYNEHYQNPIVTVSDLAQVVDKYLPIQMEKDRMAAQMMGTMDAQMMSMMYPDCRYHERANKGVFFNHTGLIRAICERKLIQDRLSQEWK